MDLGYDSVSIFLDDLKDHKLGFLVFISVNRIVQFVVRDLAKVQDPWIQRILLIQK